MYLPLPKSTRDTWVMNTSVTDGLSRVGHAASAEFCSNCKHVTGGDFRYVKKMMVKWCCKKTTVRANWQVADAQRFVLKISIT